MTQENSNKFSEELKNNPLAASLLMVNPIAGFAHLGFEISENEAKQFNISEEDSQRAVKLLKDNFYISEPQVIQIAQNEELLSSPKISAETFEREADITVNTSAEILQYSLKRFSKTNFANQKFNDLSSNDWWKLDAAGENIELECDENGITLTVNFQCELSIDFNEFKADKIKIPLKIEILPAFVVSNNQLYLSISKGQISILNFFYPSDLAEKFSSKIAKIIPFIPVCTIPMQFDLLDNEPNPTVLLTDAQVDENGILLSFHIDEEFTTESNLAKPVRKKKAKGAVGFLSDAWVGQTNLWNYDNFAIEEILGKSSGTAVMATVADFFGRNSFSLNPQGEPTADGRDHYDNQEVVGRFYDWYYPRFSTLGSAEVSSQEDLLKAFANMKLGNKEFYPEVFGDGIEAQKNLIEWIVKTQLPVIVLLDVGKLTVLENLSTGENDAQPKDQVAHWGVVYAVNEAGVKLASWGKEYFIPWKVFMKAWNCDFLPHPNNFYQIQVWENK